MIETIKQLIDGNQFILPAVMATTGATITGFIMYALKAIPLKLWNALVKATTLQLTVKTGDFKNDLNYYAALEVLTKYHIDILSRNFLLHAFYWRRTPHIIPGFGIQYIWYNGTLMWYVKNAQPTIHGGESGKIHEELTLTWFGFSKNAVEGLRHEVGLMVNADNSDEYIEGKMKIGNLTEHGIGCSSYRPDKPLDSLAISEDLKKTIRTKIDDYLNKEQMYRDLGITRKMVIMLFGPPGTGKTTLAMAIASELKYQLLIPEDLSINKMAGLMNAEMTAKSVLLFDDIDTMGITNKRKEESKDDTLSDSIMQERMGMFNNFLDGAIPLEDRVIVMCTNHIDKFDPAILRDGRITLQLEILAVEPDDVKEHFLRVYGPMPEITEWKPMLGASIYRVKERALDNRDLAVAEILKIYAR